MENYFIIKRNKVLIYVTTWMNLGNILCENKTVTRDHNPMVSFT